MHMREADAWIKDRNCNDVETKVFYPERDDVRAINYAKTFCSGCLVAMDCLKAGLRNNEQGIWGGQTEDERNEFRMRSFLRERRLNASRHSKPHEQVRPIYVALSSPSHTYVQESHIQPALLTPAANASVPTFELIGFSTIRSPEEQSSHRNQKHHDEHVPVERESSRPLLDQILQSVEEALSKSNRRSPRNLQEIKPWLRDVIAPTL